MHRLLFFILLICPSLLFAQRDVYFGERDLKKYSLDLFVDKAGDLYPSVRVPDSLMLAYDGKLRALYANQLDLFAKALTFYSINNLGTFDELYQSLQSKIILEKKNLWQQSTTNDSSIYFLIHGFRKPFSETQGEYTSTKDFQLMKDALHLQNKRVVSVYWDATFDCCFSSDVKKNNELFGLFVAAQLRTQMIAVKLGQVLNELTFPKVFLVSHSLGAKIWMETLSNVHTKFQSFNILLVAPAIRADQVTLAVRNSTTTDVSIGIVYNRHDFVLKKKDPYIGWFGPGVKKYGETSLGCNKRGAIKKVSRFENKYGSDVLFQFYNYKWVGKGHHVRNYFVESHMEDVRIFLQTN